MTSAAADTSLAYKIGFHSVVLPVSCIRCGGSSHSRRSGLGGDRGFLFNISIMDNLLLGNERVKRDDVFLACKTVEIHEYIMGLPLQYNTILEEGGSNLSSGRRQRLMLARAILRKPYILILV